MRRFHLGRPSPALVVATIALIVALGGTSYAAFIVPKNSVGTRQLKNDAVTTKKIKNGSVTGSKMNLSGVVAPHAADARYASTAGSATTAGYARSATNAGHAANADSATNAINATYADNAGGTEHASLADIATTAIYALNGVFAAGQIREDGSIVAATTELVSVSHTPNSGLYCLVFIDQPSETELASSVVSEAGIDPAPTLVPRVTNGQDSDCPSGQLAVRVQNPSGTLTDGRFSFIVPRER